MGQSAPIFELTPLEQRVLLSNNISINFQTGTGDNPTGYLMDSGAAYGAQPNGLTYGWVDTSGNPTSNSSNARDRNNSISPDQRYDTDTFMEGGTNHNWQIALPNGSYHVHLVAGDANTTNVTFNIVGNGTTLVSGTVATGSTHPWIEGTADVIVSSGILSIARTSSHADDLTYIDIWPAADDASMPAAPTNFSATSESTTTADLRWTDNSDNETSFQIQRSTDNVTFTTLTTTRTNVTTTPAPTFPNAQYFGDTGLTANTTYYYRIRAVNANPTTALNSSWSSTASVHTPTTNAEAPYGGTPWSSNGLIQAENFDIGGEAVAYHDTTTDNIGGDYRNTGVDILNGDVIFVEAGEWQKYTISIPTAGAYTLIAYGASSGTGGTYHASFTDGGNTLTTSTVTLPSTGGWYTFQPQTVGTVTFATSGTKTLKMLDDTNGGGGGIGNFDYYELIGLPAVPSALTATTVSTSQINLSWNDNSSNESGFGIERSTDQMSWTPVTTTGADATAFPDTGLLPGKQYYYRMHATNITGDSADSATASAWTLPLAPTGLSVTSATSSAINLSWAATTGAASYTLLRKTTGSFTTYQTGITGTTYSDTAVSPGITYTYEVEAVDPGGPSAPSGPISVTPPPATPTGLSVTGVTGSSISLSWGASTGATSYVLLREGPGGSSYGAVSPAPTGTTYTDSSVATGSTYSYEIEAVNSGGTSAPSSPVSGTTSPATPAGLSITGATGTSISLSWSASTGATSYVLLYEAPGDSSYSTRGTGLTTTAYPDSSLAYGSTYSYEVEAVNSSGTSAPSAPVTGKTIPAVPTLSVTGVTASSVSLSWTPSTGADTYTLLRQGPTDPGYTTYVSGLTTASYPDTLLASGSTYNYEVEAVNSGGTSPTSNAVSPMTIAAAPTLTVTGVTASSVDLSWTAPAGASSYVLLREAPGETSYGAVSPAPTGTTYTDSTVAAGSTYSYEVEAVNASGTSDPSSAATTTTLAGVPAAPSDLSAFILFTSSANLFWTDNSDNETGFEVDQSSDAGVTWTTIATTTADATFYQATGLADGITFLFRVRATNAAGDSDNTPPVSVTTPLNGPTDLTATANSASQVTLNWTDATTNAHNYTVERSPNYSTWTTLTTTVAAGTMTYEDDTAPEGAQSYYRVTATNAVTSSSSTYTSVTPPLATPTDLTAIVASPTQIGLSWTDQSSRETGYSVEESADGVTGWTVVTSALAPNASTYSITGLSANNTYYFRVQALGTTPSAYSSVVSGTTSFVTSTFTATPVSNGSIDLEWWLSASDPDATIDVLRSTSITGPFATLAPSLSGSTDFYMDSDPALVDGSHYYYRLQVSDSSGTHYSTIADAWTVLAAPSALQVTSAGTGGVALSWQNNSSTATGFVIERTGPDGSNDFTMSGSWPAGSTVLFTDTAVAANASYTYAVMATNAEENSALSASTTTNSLPPATPTGLTATAVTSTSVSLTWTAATEATSYSISRQNPDGTSTDLTSATASFTDSPLDPNSTYFYAVSAVSAGGSSDPSAPVSVTTPIGMSGLTATAVSPGEIDLSWTNVSIGSDAYQIQRSTDGINFSTLDSLTIGATTYVDATVADGTAYYYRIVSSDGSGDVTVVSDVATASTGLAAPTPFTATAMSSSEIDLAWTNVASNSSGIEIDCSIDGGATFTLLATLDPSDASYSDSTVAGGTAYTYRISATGINTNSSYSSAAASTVLAAPSNMVATNVSDNEIDLTWDLVNGATSYQILRADSSDPGNFAVIATAVTAAMFQDTDGGAGLNAALTYSYQVVAQNSTTVSSASATLSLDMTATPPAAPTAPDATQITDTSVVLTWQPPADEVPVAYDVFRNGARIVTATGTSCQVLGLTANTSYTYSIAARNASSNGSPTLATLTVTTASTSAFDSFAPSQPTGLAVSNLSGNFLQLTWTNSTDDSGSVTYDILRDGESIGSPTSATFSDFSLSPNTTYTYAIVASDAADNQSQPATITATTSADITLPASPGAVRITANTSTAVSLAWPPTSDDVAVTRYAVYRGPDSSHLGTPLGYTTGLTYTDTTAASNTQYTYGVTALDAAGNESSASTVVVTTGAPPASTDITQDQFVPDAWQNYFYNTVVPAVSALETQYHDETLGFDLRGWLSVRGTYPNFTPDQKVIENGAETSTLPFSGFVHGIQGQLAYYGGSAWSEGDPIWYDANNNNQYDSGESIIYNPWTVTVQSGTEGKKAGLNFIDGAGTGHWTAGDFIFIDNTTFAQDVGSLHNIVSEITQGSGTLGSLLSASGAPSTTLQGSGQSFSTTTELHSGVYQDFLDGTNTHFKTDLKVGDNVYVNGQWGSVLSISSDTSAQMYFRSFPSGTDPVSSVVVNNWTLIPQTTEEGMQFNFQRGQPDSTSVLFPQQFQQLRDVLSGARGVAVAAPPMSVPIPLTSLMEATNVVQDTNLDDIVQVDDDQTSFGDDTGSISFETQRDMPQVYLPLNTDGTDLGGALPVHSYLVQGGFGTSTTDVGNLTTTVTLPDDLTYGSAYNGFNAGQNSQPYAFSFATRADIDMLINEGDTHIKRVQVIRPRGDAVVFDFKWNATTNEFSPIGTPIGIDAKRLYVLRDVSTPSHTMISPQYELLFPSGIVQSFGYNGALTSVTDTNTGLSAGFAWEAIDGYGDIYPESSARYSIGVNWANGRIASVDYTATSGEKIETTLTYGGTSGNDITGLAKVDKTASQSIPQFSFSVSSPTRIVSNGIQIDRSGSFESGSVTLTETVPGSSSILGSYADTTVFNSDGLITSDTVTLDEGGGTTSTAQTSYDYSTSRARYANGAPMWGNVTTAFYPDGTWESFNYDAKTGWLTQDITPFKNSMPGDAMTGQLVQYSYDNTNSGGTAADPTLLVQPPRQALDEITGVIVSSTLNRFSSASAGAFAAAYGATSRPPTWGTAKLATSTSISGVNSYTVTTPTGKVTQSESATSNNNITSNTTSSFNGKTLSQATTTITPFGGLVTSSSSGIGQGPSSAVPAGSTDPFGRTTGVSVNDGKYTTALGNYGWLGAAKAVDPTGVETDYTYTPFGQIATATSLGIVVTYFYDLAGNVIHVNTAGSYLGQATVETNTYATYDALGRMTSATDEMGRKTTWAYVQASNGLTTTVTYNDNSTMIEKFYLDGTPISVSGTAVTPSAYDEGVRENGSTWTLTSTNDGQNWTKTFINVLGQQYKTQESGPGGVTETALTVFDGNGRPIKFTDFDGTSTFTDYDPATGAVADTWSDVAGTGKFVPGIDAKSIETDTPITNSDSVYSGSTDEDLSTTGVQSDFSASKNAGLTSEEVSNGQTSTTNTELNTPEGTDTTVTTTNPDGTQVVDTYMNGRLNEEQTLGTTGAQITDTKYGYDALGRNNTIQEWTGTTTFKFFADGSVSEVDFPDGRTQVVNATDPKSGTPTQVTLPNGQSQTTGINLLGQQITQSGAGVLPARFTYDANTGALTSLKLFQSGTLDSGTAETTTWAYDPATGLLTSKTYNDGTSDTYTYNAKFQLAEVDRPGVFTNYTYNAAGQQTSSTATDQGTGDTVTNAVGSYDDQGRATSVTQTSANADGQVQSSASNAYAFDAQGNVSSETQAAGVKAVYNYYDVTDLSPTAEPGAIANVKLVQNGQVISETDYAYDPSSKRLATITVETFNADHTLASSQAFTYVYKSGTNLIQSISTGPVLTAFGYEANTGRLASITSTNSNTSDDSIQTLYDANYTYNTNDQRQTENVTQLQSDGTTNSHNWTYGYDNVNELTSVTNTADNSSVYTYGYDGVGNRTNAFGTANSLNEYSSFTYNQRGDLTDDGTFAYAWNAADQLVAVTAHDNSVKVAFQYDGQGRQIQKDDYTWDAEGGGSGARVLSSTRKFVYNGTNLVAELDGSNNLITGYTWGPNGLMSVTDYTGSAPKVYAVILDGGGNVAGLVDTSTGAVAARYTYDPYGKLLNATGPAADVCNLRYKQGYCETEFNANLFGVRFENWGGFWLSEDPTGIAGGLNTFVYCSNDPINLLDPTGTDAITVTDRQMADEAIAEAQAENPGKEGSDYIHWYNTKTFIQRVGDIYESKVEWYKRRGYSVVQVPLPPRGLSIGPDLRSDAEIRAQNEVNDLARRLDNGQVVTPEGAQTALIMLKTAQNGSGFPGVVWEVAKDRGPDLLAGYGALKNPSGGGFVGTPEYNEMRVQGVRLPPGMETTSPLGGRVQSGGIPGAQVGAGGATNSVRAPSVTHPNGHGVSIRDVNPGAFTENCAECSIYVDRLFAGEGLSVATNTGITTIGQVERVVGRQFSAEIQTIGDIEGEIAKAGPGSRGIIYAHKGDPEVGHYFNVVNQGGVVRFIDGQSATAASIGSFKAFYLMRTK